MYTGTMGQNMFAFLVLQNITRTYDPLAHQPSMHVNRLVVREPLLPLLVPPLHVSRFFLTLPPRLEKRNKNALFIDINSRGKKN